MACSFATRSTEAGFTDMPANGGYVLGLIESRGSGLSDVIADLGVSKQTASQLVDTLVVRGYLERSVDPDDRRRVLVTLTERGRAASDAVFASVEEIDARLVAAVGEERMTHTKETLAVLVDLWPPSKLTWKRPQPLIEVLRRTPMPDTTPEPLVLVDADGPVLTVTINRPEKRNATNAEVLCRLYDAWVRLDEDDSLRVAILTGKGTTFCAGMDLAEILRLREGVRDNEWIIRLQDDPGISLRAFLKNYRPTKPIILAAEGFARAGGTEILQGTDIRVAGESAVFGVTEVQRGLFPMAGSAVRLRRQISYAVAAEMLLTGEDIPARRAYELGLINHVVPDGEALSAGPGDRRSDRPQRSTGRQGHPGNPAPDRMPARGTGLCH